MDRLFWYVAVEDGEELNEKEEYVDQECVGDDLRYLLDRFFPGIETRDPSQDKAEKDEQRWS